MRKKRVIKFTLFIFALFILGLTYSTYQKNHPRSLLTCCAFCNIEVLENQKFYEDDLVIALYSHKPVLPGHCLIIPKRHVERFEFLLEEEILQIGHIIKKIHCAASSVYATSSYLLLQKNGVEVGQTVPHVHFHYIPRQEQDNSILAFVLKMFLAKAKQPIPSYEMRKNVDALKQSLTTCLEIP